MGDRTILQKQIRDLQCCAEDARQVMLVYQDLVNKHRDKWYSINATMEKLEDELEKIK